MKPQECSGFGDALTRRGALARIASGTFAAAAAGVFANRAEAATTDRRRTEDARREFIFFSKPFQLLSFDELGRFAAEAGYTGIEFPVRPGGHIEPEAVEDELPKAIQAFRKNGITVPLITTGINEASDSQMAERVLRSAARLGVPRFRMAYYRYDLKQPIAAQLKSFGPKLDDLVAMAAEIGIKPLYQNHSGANMAGASIWDIYYLMQKHSPRRIGMAFDIGHAIVEGSKCWPLYFNLVRDYIDVAYIKDPAWSPERRQFQWAPLGTGVIPKGYFEMLAKSGFRGPMSVHVEYYDHKDPANQDRFRAAFRADLETLRKYVG